MLIIVSSASVLNRIWESGLVRNFHWRLARYTHLLDCRETIALSAFLVLSKARKAFDCLKEVKETMKGKISSRWTSTKNKAGIIFHSPLPLSFLRIKLSCSAVQRQANTTALRSRNPWGLSGGLEGKLAWGRAADGMSWRPHQILTCQNDQKDYWRVS